MAQGYIELLSDLMILIPSYPYDRDKKITLFRKPCKYQFTNLLSALCWHPKKPRTIQELKNLGGELGSVLEWVVSQEIWRRICIKTADLPDHLNFWQSEKHEVDFLLPDDSKYIEVKAGKTNPLEFSWFLKSFSKETLSVISQTEYNTERIKGMTLETFLLQTSSSGVDIESSLS